MLHHRMRRAVAGAGTGGILSNGSVLDFNYDSLSTPYTWINTDTSPGLSTQESFGGRDTFKMLGGINTTPSQALRIADTGETIPQQFVLSHEIYIAEDGSDEVTSPALVLRVSSSATLFVQWFNGTLHVYDGTAWIDTGISYALAQWQRWTFDCDYSTEATATCDIYLGNSLGASGVDCSHVSTGWTEGEIYAWCRDAGGSVDNPLYYADRIIIGDGFA